MDAFSPSHQPDEGYSEDPLNPPICRDLRGPLSTLTSIEDLPAWLTANANQVSHSLKSGELNSAEAETSLSPFANPGN